MMGRNNCTCQGERSKAQLMETIGQSAFAAYDTLLYMDTHPQDQEARWHTTINRQGYAGKRWKNMPDVSDR